MKLRRKMNMCKHSLKLSLLLSNIYFILKPPSLWVPSGIGIKSFYYFMRKSASTTSVSSLPVGSELAGDAQHINNSFHLQLPTAYCCGDKTACPANASTAGKGAWAM